MFAPVFLPLQITFFVMLGLVVGLPFLFRRFTKHPVLASLGTSALLGFPMLFAIGSIVDSFRYGEFQHDDAKRLNDGYVQLPTDATEITLHKYASGHELKFKTTKASLETWMTELTNHRLKYMNVTPFEPGDSHPNFDAKGFANLFGRHGWQYPADAVIYRGWRSGRGSGFDVWYSDVEQSAYIHASYW